MNWRKRSKIQKNFFDLNFQQYQNSLIMNYQILLESYCAGEGINKDELSLLELELDSQLESIKFSRTQGCTEKAPKHICEAAQVCEGSN